MFKRIFNDPINITPLCGNNFADKYFSKNKIIKGVNYKCPYGESYVEDVTFLSTVRALCYSHMSEDETLELDYEEVDIPNWDNINHNTYSSGIVIFNASILKNENLITDTPDGFEYFDEPRKFFAQGHTNIMCFQNYNKKICILFVENLTMADWHIIQAGVTKYLPWYFPKKDGATILSSDERAVVNGILDDNYPENYIKALQNIEIKMQIRDEYIKEAIKNVSTKKTEDNLELMNLYREKQTGKIVDVVKHDDFVCVEMLCVRNGVLANPLWDFMTEMLIFKKFNYVEVEPLRTFPGEYVVCDNYRLYSYKPEEFKKKYEQV